MYVKWSTRTQYDEILLQTNSFSWVFENIKRSLQATVYERKLAAVKRLTFYDLISGYYSTSTFSSFQRL